MDGMGNELVTFIADADIDCDGSGGNPEHDPYFQPETTLKVEGKSLDAYKVPFVVVPPVVIKKTKGIVMGSLCLIENTHTKEICIAVVGDVGPTRKVGELSPRAAGQISVDPNPVSGGESSFIVKYSIFVGIPAVIDGFTYPLRKSS
jgi:hypothetical protein